MVLHRHHHAITGPDFKIIIMAAAHFPHVIGDESFNKPMMNYATHHRSFKKTLECSTFWVSITDYSTLPAHFSFGVSSTIR